VNCHPGANKILNLVKYDIGPGECCYYPGPEVYNEVKKLVEALAHSGLPSYLWRHLPIVDCQPGARKIFNLFRYDIGPRGCCDYPGTGTYNEAEEIGGGTCP
jgi:hypothetical protein